MIEFAESVQSLHGDVLAAAQAGDFVQLTLLESALLVRRRGVPRDDQRREL